MAEFSSQEIVIIDSEDDFEDEESNEIDDDVEEFDFDDNVVEDDELGGEDLDNFDDEE